MTRARHTAYACLLAAAGLLIAAELVNHAINQAVTLPARRIR